MRMPNVAWSTAPFADRSFGKDQQTVSFQATVLRTKDLNCRSAQLVRKILIINQSAWSSMPISPIRVIRRTNKTQSIFSDRFNVIAHSRGSKFYGNSSAHRKQQRLPTKKEIPGWLRSSIVLRLLIETSEKVPRIVGAKANWNKFFFKLFQHHLLLAFLMINGQSTNYVWVYILRNRN